jgi:hypothetical protein
MAHFAQLDNNNEVLQVIVVHNNELLDENNQESETKGLIFCKSLFGDDTNWIQTSYNGNIRKNYAGIGYTYDLTRDAFIGLKPFESWLLDEDTCQWKAPIDYPTDGEVYLWNEELLSWDKV